METLKGEKAIKTVKKAVIPAAGMGTRFLPAAKAVPKEMLPLIDIPIIQYIVIEAVLSGIEDIIIITGRGKEAIENHFDKSPELEYFLQQKGQREALDMVKKISDLVNIHYIRQKEPLGLGHAILQAEQHVGEEPFVVLLGDEIFRGNIPASKQLIKSYERTGSTVLAVRQVARHEVSSYGIIKPEKIDGGLIKVSDLIEKPKVDKAPSNLAIVGRYVIKPQVFDVLKNTPPGHNGEIQLTDALRTLNKGRNIYALEIEGNRYDVGSKPGYLKATVDFALERDDLRGEFKEFLAKKSFQFGFRRSKNEAPI